MAKLQSVIRLLLPAATLASSTTNPHAGFVNGEFKKLGCFKREAHDTNDKFVYMDNTCRTKSGKQRCRSGLPFFRLPLHDGQSFLDCQAFCLSKGMDLAGLVAPEMECRCGASRKNTALWKHDVPRDGLMLANETESEDELNCSILVWQYAGEFRFGAIPKPLTRMSARDQIYVDSIVAGEDIEHRFVEKPATPIGLKDASPTLNLSHPTVQGMCQDQNQGNPFGQPCAGLKPFCDNPQYAYLLSGACPVTCGICSPGGFHPCYPENCGSGGGPWKKGADGIAVLNYYFDSNVDDERKNAFMKATQWWSSTVCVRFQESTAPPVMQVGIYDLNACDAGVGYPGPQGTAKVNLGWCNSQSAVGNIAHELGHILGMNHEQQRPDASKQFYTPVGWKGPYLNIHWDGIQSDWVPQYIPSDVDYVGSSQRGYADYDFESIMHYPEDGKNFNAENPIYDKVIGNRDHLSAGDIARANDMYQCNGSPAPTPSPSPPPSPPPPPPPGPPSGCIDQPYSEAQCDGWKAAGYCSSSSTEYQFMEDHCPRSCGFCQGCSDRESLDHCQGWKNAGYCSPSSQYYNNAKYYCADTCDACGGYSTFKEGIAPLPPPTFEAII